MCAVGALRPFLAGPDCRAYHSRHPREAQQGEQGAPSGGVFALGDDSTDDGPCVSFTLRRVAFHREPGGEKDLRRCQIQNGRGHIGPELEITAQQVVPLVAPCEAHGRAKDGVIRAEEQDRGDGAIENPGAPVETYSPFTILTLDAPPVVE